MRKINSENKKLINKLAVAINEERKKEKLSQKQKRRKKLFTR